jgi:hypothetical protein
MFHGCCKSYATQISLGTNRIALSVVEGYRSFMPLCDKVMQLRKNDWERENAAFGDYRTTDAERSLLKANRVEPPLYLSFSDGDDRWMMARA